MGSSAEFDLKQFLAEVMAYKPKDPNNAGKSLLISDLNAKPQSVIRDKIIRTAQRNRYSDFGSCWATPALLLVEHLRRAGFDDMVQKALNGDYDHDG